MPSRSLSNPERWILKGIPLLFIVGSIMHFLYDLLGENPIIGMFSPINESVWEHMKMVLLPIILWYIVYYFLKNKQYKMDKNKWLTSGLVSLFVALVTIPLLFYFYTEAFGVELLIVDILILFVAVLFGQGLGLHYYKYGKGINAGIVMFIFVVVVLVFMVFTFYPPHIPMFKDGMTGTYGIG